MRVCVLLVVLVALVCASVGVSARSVLAAEKARPALTPLQRLMAAMPQAKLAGVPAAVPVPASADQQPSAQPLLPVELPMRLPAVLPLPQAPVQALAQVKKQQRPNATPGRHRLGLGLGLGLRLGISHPLLELLDEDEWKSTLPPFVNPTSISVPVGANFTVLVNHSVQAGGTTGFWGFVTEIGTTECSDWKGQLVGGPSCSDGNLVMFGMKNLIDQDSMTAQFEYRFLAAAKPATTHLSFCQFRPWEKCDPKDANTVPVTIHA